MSVCCSTSAFKTSLEDALASVAEMGFSTVDLICIPGWGHVMPADLAADFEAEATRVESLLAEHNLRPVAMNMAVAATYKREDEAQNAQRLKEVEGVARLMARLGVGIASFYPGYRCEDRPWEDVLADSAETIREMLDIGARHGVTFAVETHFATIYETLEQGVRLLEAVPELMVAFDPSHYAMQSIDLRDCAELLDRAAHMHVRDAAPEKMCVPVGEGTVDFEWLVDAMGHRGYEGHWSIEYLPGKTGDPKADIIKLRDILEPMVG